MVRLLKCQQEVVNTEDLEEYGIALICSLLDTFEVDLVPEELTEIRQFAKDWARE